MLRWIGSPRAEIRAADRATQKAVRCETIECGRNRIRRAGTPAPRKVHGVGAPPSAARSTSPGRFKDQPLGPDPAIMGSGCRKDFRAAARIVTAAMTDKPDFTKREDTYKETKSQGHRAALHRSEFFPLAVTLGLSGGPGTRRTGPPVAHAGRATRPPAAGDARALRVPYTPRTR